MNPRLLLCLILAAAATACSKPQPVSSIRAATDGSAPAGTLPTVEVPEPLKGRIPANTRQLERFNPQKLAAFVAAVPLMEKSRKQRALERVLFWMFADPNVYRANDKLLPSMRRDRDFWIADIVQVDEKLQAYVDAGVPYDSDSFAGHFMARLWLPSDDPSALRGELEEVCASKRYQRCRWIGNEELDGYLMVDVHLPFPGLRPTTPAPLEPAPYPARATSAWSAFLAEGIASGSYQTVADARLTEAIQALAGTLSPQRMQRAGLDRIPRDEYYDYTLRFFQDPSGAHADVHHTYTPTGKKLAGELDVNVELPTLNLDAPVLQGEWAGNFDDFSVGFQKSLTATTRDDLVVFEQAWAAAPLWVATKSPLGLQVFGLTTPFFNGSGLVAMRAKVGRASEGGKQKPASLTGAVLLLTRKLDGEELRRFHQSTGNLTGKIGRPKAPIVQDRGAYQLHIYPFDDTPIEQLLGEDAPVSTSPQLSVDLSRFLFKAASVGSASAGVSTRQTMPEMKQLSMRRNAHEDGGSLQVSYGDGKLPSLDWRASGVIAPKISGCALETTNASQVAFLEFLRVRERPTAGLSALQDHALTLAENPCAKTPDAPQQWLDFERRFGAGEFKTPEFGFEEFCTIADVCEIPADAAPENHTRLLARCLATKYPNSAASALLNVLEKMPRPQARAYLIRQQREEGIEQCPAIDLFTPDGPTP